MSEQTLAYVDNNSIIHRADALSKLAWVVVIIICTFQLSTSEARAIMLASLLVLAIFFARIPLVSILRASPLIFGIALLLDDDTGGAAALKAYTPDWAAPEQIAHATITTRTDVHALGRLLILLLGGDALAPAAKTDVASIAANAIFNMWDPPV